MPLPLQRHFREINLQRCQPATAKCSAMRAVSLLFFAIGRQALVCFHAPLGVNALLPLTCTIVHKSTHSYSHAQIYSRLLTRYFNKQDIELGQAPSTARSLVPNNGFALSARVAAGRDTWLTHIQCRIAVPESLQQGASQHQCQNTAAPTHAPPRDTQSLSPPPTLSSSLARAPSLSEGGTGMSGLNHR